MPNNSEVLPELDLPQLTSKEQIANGIKIDESDIRSDEVQEILNHEPNWIIRSGIPILLVLIVILLIISWFIRYPDIINGKAILTTKISPIKLVAQTNGKLQKIYMKNGSIVEKGQYIAELENSLDKSIVEFLLEMSNQVENYLQNPSKILIFNDSLYSFGELQNDYNSLKSNITKYNWFVNHGFEKKKINNINTQISYYEELLKISYNQLGLAELDLSNANKKYLSDKILFQKNVISQNELFEMEAALNRNKQNLENLKKITLQYKITIAEYENQLINLVHEFEETKLTLKELIYSHLRSINNSIIDWQQNYVLKAPFAGNLNFLSNLSEGEYIQAGSFLFAVIPNNNQYICNLEIPVTGMGKVREGQRVNIKLDNYPYQQFGHLLGEIIEITPIPNLNKDQLKYFAKVKLLNGLQTTYHKELEYKPEMQGTAEIVTADLRIIERIFNQFRLILG